MNESTWIDDLLECSVCLERLHDSKVLPCQHTFCRKCLEVIVDKKKELRCPECRILVDVKIDELPPNVLLMRILEGLKNATNRNLQEVSEVVHSNIENYHLRPETSTSIKKDYSHVSTRLENDAASRFRLAPLMKQSQSSGVQNIPKALALYDFHSQDKGDLNFRKGDVILIKRRIDSNWLVGTVNGCEGAFPLNYVQIIVPLPVPQCVALYDFKMGPNEEEGCLTFKKGTVINVLRRVDKNWAEGRIGTNIGIFPITFTEMNSLARHILEQDSDGHAQKSSYLQKFPKYTARSLPPLPNLEGNLSDATSSSPSVLLSPNSSNSSNSNSVSGSPPNQNVSNSNESNTVRHRYSDKEKRNSLTNINTNKNLNLSQSNRHSAEILSLPFVGTVETTSAQQNVSNLSNPVSASKFLRDKCISEPKNMFEGNRANLLKQHSSVPPPLPWSYMALYPYKPKKHDELELKKGCIYIVTERCLDGWFKGRNWVDKSGVFPGNYVTPLRLRDHQQFMHQKQLKNSNNIQAINSTIDSVDASDSHCPLPELPPRTLNSSISHNITSTIWPKTDNLTEQTTVPQTKLSTYSDTANTKYNDTKETNVNKSTENSSSVGSTSSVLHLMKRLTNIKGSKSPLSHNPNCIEQQASTNSNGFSSKNKSNISHSVHIRSGSCPSQLLQNLPADFAKENVASGVSKNDMITGSQKLKAYKERPSLENINDLKTVASDEINHSISLNSSSATPLSVNMIHHRKTQSLDTTCKMNQISNSIKTTTNKEGRFRCIVSYPPNSEFELELNVGDIVFVHKKQRNGWYKGTHSKTNKTGLFPASFVEPLL